MTERRPAKRPGAGPVIWVSVMLFAGLFAFLTYRFAAGQDPSLAGASAAQPVHVRKVIKRRVITTIVPTPGANTVTSGPVSSSSYGSEAIATGAS